MKTASQRDARAELRHSSRTRLDDLFLRMNSREVGIVATFVRHAESRPLLWTALAINQLCNGWIYVPVVLYVGYLREWKLLVALGAGVSIAHLFYGSAKPRFARVRPFHFTQSIPVRSRCLDLYSFPSGHCMTLSVVSLLVCWRHHALIPALAAGLVLLCWARVASGQHYPTDLIAGIGVGSFVATSVALCLF